MSEPISIHVWSDVICPWCYIGKARLDKALEKFDGEVDVEYHSFELSPDTPDDFSGTAADYLSQRRGIPIEQVHQMLNHTAELAEAEGLVIDYEIAQQTKTLLAHEAIHFARLHDKQIKMVDRLFKAYFQEGRLISDIDELVGLGGEIGLNEPELFTALSQHSLADAVASDLQTARDLNITGVPFFVIDRRFAVSGAQDPSVFLSTLEQVREERN